MKTLGMAVALLLAVASGRVNAQSGGNKSGRYPTPTAEGVPGTRAGTQATSSGQKNASSTSTGAARSQSGSGSFGSQSGSTTSGQGGKGKEGSKGKAKPINQQAAGVLKSNDGGSGTNSGDSRMSTKKQ